METTSRVHGWKVLGGNSPLFTVTAEYTTPSGRQRGEGRVMTSIAGAPIVGGTVLLWFAGDGSDTSNIDIKQDPHSVIDPDAEITSPHLRTDSRSVLDTVAFFVPVLRDLFAGLHARRLARHLRKVRRERQFAEAIRDVTLPPVEQRVDASR